MNSRTRTLATCLIGAAVLASCDRNTDTTNSRGATSTASASTSYDSPGGPGATSVTSPATDSARPSPSNSPTASPSSSSAAPASSTAATACVAKKVAEMTPEQRAGQLVMVAYQSGTSNNSIDTSISQTHAGGFFFLGGWHGAANVSRAVAHARSLVSPLSTANLGVFVAADQEGGDILQLKGDGFAPVPTALSQGGASSAARTAYGRSIGSELKRAGVDVDLAPVADSVDPALGTGNGPIGKWRREYSLDPRTNAAAVADVTRGLRSAGVEPTLKHFPGLGRIVNNTDFSATDITDTTTGTNDPALTPFKAGIDAGARIVMVGTANYQRIDPGVPAAFSPKIVDGMLRHDLGFDGVVVTDDLEARSVAGVPAAQRAIRSVDAGVDIVMTSNPTTAAAFARAITSKAAGDPGFAAKVRASVTRVVSLKASMGLAPGCRD